ncbi:chorismate mutase [Pseudozyma hubeiensis SY62]|uniref:chorismate mutase n=1 Tax=Pseudozyma hubeiensis (strain SY62) TaxID=1305764 RepID=R9P0L3_PSEHS|nr:chorismate mutase [Pseudozyma hubeiensis SY62]GAC94691.1 chorismate mutase [Pseudozyma hubeiensis SY62]
MKLLLSLHSLVLLLVSLRLTAASPPSKPAVDDLTTLRAQLAHYETPLIQTYLSRISFGVSLPHERSLILSALINAPYPAPRSIEAWLSTPSGRAFGSDAPFPPATRYVTPAVPHDAQTQPVDGIWSTGRTPADPTSISYFLLSQIHTLPPPNTTLTDISSLLNLDTLLLHLTSARVLLGHPIGLSKFTSSSETFCRILTNTSSSPSFKSAQISAALTDHKQESIVLSRISQKTDLFSTSFSGDPPYQRNVTSDLLTLFSAYLIPITTHIETQTIIGLRSSCT